MEKERSEKERKLKDWKLKDREVRYALYFVERERASGLYWQGLL